MPCFHVYVRNKPSLVVGRRTATGIPRHPPLDVYRNLGFSGIAQIRKEQYCIVRIYFHGENGWSRKQKNSSARRRCCGKCYGVFRLLSQYRGYGRRIRSKILRESLGGDAKHETDTNHVDELECAAVGEKRKRNAGQWH